MEYEPKDDNNNRNRKEGRRQTKKEVDYPILWEPMEEEEDDFEAAIRVWKRDAVVDWLSKTGGDGTKCVFCKKQFDEENPPEIKVMHQVGETFGFCSFTCQIGFYKKLKTKPSNAIQD
jgi:hypothetical protein